MSALQPPRRVHPRFGRVSVGMQGRVMVTHAEGPFDAALMAAAKRAILLAGKRLPADLRFGDLIEVRGSMELGPGALAELQASIEAFGRGGIIPVSTVFLVPPGTLGIEALPALMDIWRPSRPVRRADTFDAAWALVNADLAAAGLPTQAPPRR